MLAPENRMRDKEDFSQVFRRGNKVGSTSLVIHYLTDASGDIHPARVGFVIQKKQISRAVYRNRVKRRLRAIMRQEVTGLNPGTKVVIRVLAPAAGLKYAQLQQNVQKALERAKFKAAQCEIDHKETQAIGQPGTDRQSLPGRRRTKEESEAKPCC